MSSLAASQPSKQEQKKSRQTVRFKAQHALVVTWFLLIFVFHALSIYLFCSGFLLSRLVLPDRSQCASPPVANTRHPPGSHDKGCWHPKSFDKAVVVLVDALRYDFTVPVASPPPGQPTRHFHNALPVLHETAAREPHRALLRPFIADPPTTTLQRLKGLTTGTLPTFIEAGSNFAGTAIDEDNLIEQLFLAGKRVVHLGDDTWHALFPGCFDANLTRAYDSFNVWDLHTLDDGVTQHLFPLLAPPMARRWDVVVAHYLGVDHAGHRYGPDHPAMRDKLRQMDAVLRRLMHALDDDTLLVVMGDHGMDAKGDHGGESDDEVEAALWMYAKRGIFGRSDPAFATPPATAKHRPVSQIDLVPTLAYLLGLPVPFNNLGQPIEEAFLGPHGTDHENLARVSHMTAAQIQRYQAQYALARPSDASIAAPVHQLWRSAASTWQHVSSAPAPAPPASWRSAHTASAAFQAAHLRICKDQWARFDLPSMALGLLGLLSTLAVLALYAQGLQADAAAAALAPALVLWGVGAAATAALAAASLAALAARPVARPAAFAAVQAGCAAALFVMSRSRPAPRLPFPRTPSGALSALATLLLCAALASNSYTIWEDRQLLFLLATFAAFLLAASFALPDPAARRTGVAHALAFLAATRLASLSRLCRDEQAPLCASTFYASPHSSTSAPWQTALPFAITLLLPPALRAFFARADSYHGSAVLWLGRALPAGLALVALHWLLDAADDANWYPAWPPETLKNARVVLAQLVLALAAAAGYATYIWAAPLLLVHERGPRILVFGYANAHAARYFLLLPIWHLALSLLQKPTAQAALALLTLSITHLLTVLSATGLAATDSPWAPPPSPSSPPSTSTPPATSPCSPPSNGPPPSSRCAPCTPSPAPCSSAPTPWPPTSCAPWPPPPPPSGAAPARPRARACSPAPPAPPPRCCSCTPRSRPPPWPRPPGCAGI